MAYPYYIDSNKRYWFKSFKVYWAFRAYESEQTHKRDMEKSFTGQFLYAGFDSFSLGLDKEKMRFCMVKDQIQPKLNWFGVSTYSPCWVLMKGNKSLTMSLQGVLAPYNDKYSDLFNSRSVKYIKLQDGDNVIYEDWTGQLPSKEIVNHFINE